MLLEIAVITGIFFSGFLCGKYISDKNNKIKIYRLRQVAYDLEMVVEESIIDGKINQEEYEIIRDKSLNVLQEII